MHLYIYYFLMKLKEPKWGYHAWKEDLKAVENNVFYRLMHMISGTVAAYFIARTY